MKLIDKIKEFAKEAHDGQLDKAHKNYFLHVEAVVNAVHNEKEKMVAYLHDVIEDTKFKKDDLEKLGVPVDVIDAVVLLTKIKNYDLDKYYEEIKKNDLARNVKIADLEHNMRIDRLENPNEKDFARIEKYKRYHEYLCKN